MKKLSIILLILSNFLGAVVASTDCSIFITNSDQRIAEVEKALRIKKFQVVDFERDARFILFYQLGALNRIIIRASHAAYGKFNIEDVELSKALLRLPECVGDIMASDYSTPTDTLLGKIKNGRYSLANSSPSCAEEISVNKEWDNRSLLISNAKPNVNRAVGNFLFNRINGEPRVDEINNEAGVVSRTVTTTTASQFELKTVSVLNNFLKKVVTLSFKGSDLVIEVRTEEKNIVCQYSQD